MLSRPNGPIVSELSSSARDTVFGFERADFVPFAVVSSALLIAESLILFRFGDLGLVLHGFVTLLLIWLIQRAEKPSSLLYQSLLLVPVLRVFNLGLPIFTDDSLVFLGVIYVFLLMSTWMIVRSQNLSLDDLGMTWDKAELIIPGMVIGLVLGVIQYILALESLTYDPTIRNYILVVLTTGLLVGFVEELIFRGLIQRWVSQVFNDWIAIIGVSILFGFMHSVWLAPLDIVFAGVVSVFLGWAYASSNNLWFITSIHAMINVGGFLLAPLFLSGIVGAA